MAGKMIKRLLSGALAITVAIPANFMPARAAEETVEDYLLYPTPHKVEYQVGDYILGREMNVIYDKGIDKETKDRLEEVAALKDITVTETDAPKAGTTTVYVGVHGEDGKAEDYITKEYKPEASLFEKTDSYFLASDENVISVLGKDTDSAFYGLTTLYHVFAQLESLTIRNFEIEDYADVVSRGFIEGYYGNPWSTEDRVNLMEWGGYYKLNSYFYAPKDDPKHNAKWRELYTDEEIEKKIKPLAEAGNKSKCRFVFALHPYMNSPIGTGTGGYDADLKIMQAKFEQVIKAGVRQIAILADDAGNVGADNYVKMLTDMTAWVKEMQKTYPDLKLNIPFCTVEYMGRGESYYSRFPENVQVVMTGGKVWGEVSADFTAAFKGNTGRSPYMWINWPCTDNSKKHLIMGGYDTFLHPKMDGSQIQGIVLNPMQQSEPSKVAIFGNASYSWNIWETKEEADKTWNDAFSFVDHNSAVPNAASDALREMSKHMMNQAMDNRVTPLQESVVLKEKLNPFKEALEAGTVTAEMTDELIDEFKVLQKASKTYRTSGNEAIKGQIVYWLNCWDDTTEAAIAYLNGVKSAILGDTSAVVNYNIAGKAAFDRSKTYGFHYVDHQEYAEVGVQHIVPFINALAEYVSAKAELAADPEKVIRTYITNRKDMPAQGSVDNIFDGDDSTKAIYQNPNKIGAGDYIGVKYNKLIAIEDIRFVLGAGKDHFDHAKLQYLTDKDEWADLQLTGMENSFTGVRNQVQEVSVAKANLPNDFQAKGIRLITTAANAADAWLEVREIQINKDATQETEDERYTGTVTFDKMGLKGGKAEDLFDGNKGTEIMLAKAPYEGADKDGIPQDAYLQVTLNEPKAIGSVRVVQGQSAASDVFTNAELQYQADGSETWQKAGTLTNEKDQTVTFATSEKIKAIRIQNKQAISVWVRLGEIDIRARKEESIYTNVENCPIKGEVKEGNASLQAGTVTLKKGQYVGVDLKNVKAISDITANVGNAENVKVQTSRNEVIWTDVTAKALEDARYVRIYNAGDTEQSVKIDKFSVSYSYIGDKTVESDFAQIEPKNDMRTNGKVDNVFDGNLSTFGKITGTQDAGKKIVFDLGETVDFKTFRYYVKETCFDFLRHAKIEVATSKDAADDEWTKILEVGNAEAVQLSNLTTAKDAGYLTHDSTNPGNVYAEATNLNVSGRYLRIVPLTTYTARWVELYELQINGGAYMSTESNRDIVSDIIEEPGQIPSNMFDGDFTTTYKPSAENGSFTYRISEPNQKTIRMIQNGQVSNAVVQAVLYKDGKVQEAVELGKLNQAINEFAVPADSQILEIIVTWKETIPELSIVKTKEKAKAEVNKTALNEALKKSADDKWTADSKAAFDEAKAIAQEIANNNYATQEIVDMATNTLNAAYQAAVVKGDASALKKAVENKKAGSENEIEIYSARTYATYELAITEAEEALKEEANLLQEEIDVLLKAITDAEAALQYSLIQRELAELELQNAPAYDEANYTEVSYKEYTDAKAALDGIVKADKAERKNPKEIYAVLTKFEQAKEGLVNVEALHAKLAEVAKKDEKLYTKDSWAALQEVVKTVEGYLKNGTKEQVADAVKALDEAVANLEIKENNVQKVIDELKKLNKEDYTSASYGVLAGAIAKAEADMTKGDEALDKANISAMREAEKALVSIVDLKAAIAESEKHQAKDYTADSYKVLQDAVTAAETLKENGTKEEVADAAEAIRAAINGLEKLASGMDEYRDSIVLKTPAEDYTDASYAAYKEAYDALMVLDSKTTTEKQYQAAKSAFEKAEAKLVVQLADYTKVEKAKIKIPADLSIYTDSSVKALKAVLAGIDENLPRSKQNMVDAYADAIETAIGNLVLKKPSEGGGAGTTPEGGMPGTPNGGSSNGAAATGDSVNGSAMAALLLSLLAMVVLMRRKMFLNLLRKDDTL